MHNPIYIQDFEKIKSLNQRKCAQKILLIDKCNIMQLVFISEIVIK